MRSLLTYFQWISRGIGIYSDVRWLGLPSLKSKHISNAENGQKVYNVYCAMCHGKEGDGELANEVPPLWGPKSFNVLAGMHVEKTLASFIYYNMPYEDPGLSEEQALDVAAFIARQPRPGLLP
jgi:thiosulfate dehydrogenase